ncbi:MAG: uracil-DNA glycosylase [Bacillota bacterium]
MNLKIVLGEGPNNPKLMFVGEAPGANEVAQGRPFVGAAGKNLSEMLAVAGISREEAYVTNIVKHRVSRINPKTGREVNRPVKKSELDDGRVFLLKEIEEVQPQIICTLGNSALQGLTGEFELMIGDVHGRVIEREIAGSIRKIFPLYHPASIIYDRSLKERLEEDLEKLSAEVFNSAD